MIALLGLLAALAAGEGAAADCPPDAGALVAEARAALGPPGTAPAPEALSRARGLLHAARRLDTSSSLALEAADLAFAAGDDDEGDDLLAAAAETDPHLLAGPELLRLARRAEDRRRWREATERYRDLSRALGAEGATAPWIAPRVRELEIEAEADRIAAPPALPPIEARLALADARSALAAGRLRDARASARTALRLAPAYVEALLTLAAVETRAGRRDAAIHAGRDALAADPDRVEALTLLANLLWAEPDRAAKEESLADLDRAAAARPDLRALLRLSATRWAEYGDAARAQERLDRFLAGATKKERDEAAALRETLSARPAAPVPTPPPAPETEEPASAAVDRWRKAQVYAARGDGASLAAALVLLAEAEALDPGLARIPELSAAIHERRSEWKAAEDDLGRAIRADPSRATSRESLARLLERDPARNVEALRAWRLAGEAGSSEAWFRLAQAAERAGKGSEARILYARYRSEAPAGVHAAEAAAAAERLEARRHATLATAVAAALVLLAAGAAALGRRRAGRTLEEWLSRRPESAAEARRLVGRLRHEALKHGGMLLADGADRLEGDDADARRGAAALLSARLFGDAAARGLVGEVRISAAALRDLARGQGVRLDLARDPVLAHVLAGERALRGARRPLERLAAGRRFSAGANRSVVRRLRRAALEWRLASGAELERAIDRAAALPVRLDALEALLARVAEEGGREAPPLEILGAPPERDVLPPVRVSAADWETVWRNLFRNALAAGRLAVSASERRDASTGEARLRFVLFDDLPALSVDAVRGSPADRGLGVVAEILRRNDGSVHVLPGELPGFSKGVGFELPAAEGLA